MSIAVVIPCFRVKASILDLIAEIGPEVKRIFVVDDACPEESGKFVEANLQDPRVRVIYHSKNRGVGGALKSGYLAALEEDLDIVVKLDGDGQMNPHLIPALVSPIQEGVADYVKGNRFFSPRTLQKMPLIRLFGNSVLSFVAKAATGHWHIMDPNNGFTAIHCHALRLLPFDRIHDRFFFETDMLFRLYTIEAVVSDLPMDAVYEDEESNLSIISTLKTFPPKYLHCFLKRLFYHYLLKNFNVAALQGILGLGLVSGGAAFGIYSWLNASMAHRFTSSGTVMLAALPIILGMQLILAATSYDISYRPMEPLQRRIGRLLECSDTKAKKLISGVKG